MLNIYKEVSTLDKRAYKKFSLSEELLMEHAALSISKYIKTNFPKKTSVHIVCGTGNNGADGLACVRLLDGYDVSFSTPFGVKSEMAKLHYKRLELLGFKCKNSFFDSEVIVDAIFGTGLNKELNQETKELIDQINKTNSFIISCDTPSGLSQTQHKTCVDADVTITMGAYKEFMFEDYSKDFLGEHYVADLGLAKELYQTQTDVKLLELEDLKLPLRDKQNTYKGSFGHLSVLSGEKSGASIISSLAAFNFGVGLVTMITKKNLNNIPYEIMSSNSLATNTSAIALGMGLGEEYSTNDLEKILDNTFPLVLDADIFYKDIILKLLSRENVVITPHPKEFIHLLKVTNIANINIDELQSKRFYYVKEFSKTYPHLVLLLKGANVLIAKDKKIYVNPHGSSKLAKGGSGDVLSGLIGSLLAQGYNILDASINASLTHTLLAKSYKGANFSMTPTDLITKLKDI